MFLGLTALGRFRPNLTIEASWRWPRKRTFSPTFFSGGWPTSSEGREDAPRHRTHCGPSHDEMTGVPRDHRETARVLHWVRSSLFAHLAKSMPRKLRVASSRSARVQVSERAFSFSPRLSNAQCTSTIIGDCRSVLSTSGSVSCSLMVIKKLPLNTRARSRTRPTDSDASSNVMRCKAHQASQQRSPVRSFSRCSTLLATEQGS